MISLQRRLIVELSFGSVSLLSQQTAHTQTVGEQQVNIVQHLAAKDTDFPQEQVVTKNRAKTKETILTLIHQANTNK